MAVTNYTNEIVGVIQVMNKRTGPFIKSDEEVLSVLAGQVRRIYILSLSLSLSHSIFEDTCV